MLGFNKKMIIYFLNMNFQNKENLLFFNLLKKN